MINKKRLLSAVIYISITAVGLILSFFGGYLLSYILDTAEIKPPVGVLGTVYYITAIIISYIFNIIIHESGHMVFGLLTGYRFASFRIGSLMLIKKDGEFKIKRFSLAGTAGQCLMTPPETDQNGNAPFILYNLGGSLFNLLFSLIFLLLAFLFKSNGYISEFCVLDFIIGIFSALLNGVPIKTRLISNDGANILSLKKSPIARKCFFTQLTVSKAGQYGTRLKELPEELFTLPEDADLKNSIIAATKVFYINRIFDSLKFEEARTEIDKLLADKSASLGLYRQLLTVDRIYLELIGDRDIMLIENMRTPELAKFIKQMKNFLSVIRTEYAYALIFERDIKKAEKIKAHFYNQIKSHPYPTDIDSENELIEISERIADK